ncbi:response regulator [bacterium]|nr:response regulator [bacterium]RQV98234.1 MAG: response regulator [bacterium]
MSVEYHVLLIEDNPADARLLELTLNEVAKNHSSDIVFKSRWVNLLETAIQYIRQNKFHIIFLDLSLPDSDGLDSIDGLLAEAGRIPVIVLSGSMDTSLYDDVLDHGAQGYILKNELNPDRLYLLLKSTIIGF